MSNRKEIEAKKKELEEADAELEEAFERSDETERTRARCSHELALTTIAAAHVRRDKKGTAAISSVACEAVKDDIRESKDTGEVGAFAGA